MFTQMTKAFAASFFLIVGTLAMFEPATAQTGVAVEAGDEISA
ncbi:hypothetical protein [Sphingomicrobium clamense]|nr:hypothetical protein [Sphingomicrobium sp. B8]